jgi:NAD(P)-dependent dehydrogenase (short-subunit alcohol dehydrogenase family)
MPSLRTLVTAAHTALGSTAARLCLARGDSVVAVVPEPRRVPLLQDLRAEHGARLEVVAGDAGDPEAAAQLAAQVATHRSALDLLVIGGEEPSVDSLETGGWETAMRRSALAPIALAHAFRRLLKAGQTPRVLGFSSLHASISGKMDGGAYQRAMAGAALNIGLRALAHDLDPDGIIVVIGDPGLYKTALHGPAFQPDAEQVVTGLLAVTAAATAETTGQFLDWTGRPRAW